MQYYNVNKNTNFIIYGAGLIGINVYNHLINNGFNVIAFLDKRANEIKIHKNIKILYPKSNYITNEEKQNSVIVITLANVFDHYFIAKQLYKLGYKNILFMDKSIGNNTNKYADILNNCYEDLLEGNCIVSKVFPIFNSYDNYRKDNINSLIIKDNGNDIIAYVPSELLYTEKNRNENVLNNRFSMYYDYSVYFSLPILSLFNTFEGKKGYDLKTYIEFYKTSHSKFSLIDDQEALRHVKDRYKVYNNMSMALNIDKSYFEKNPVKVKWNEKGYFNIVDGHHRTLFLLAKNLYLIPCKIMQSDYTKYINNDKLKFCMDYIDISRSSMNIQTNIAHPYLYSNSRINNNSTIKLVAICNYLSEKCIDVKNLSLLDINSNIGYYSRFFFKMGLEVIGLEKNSTYFNFAKLLNDLFYCNSIKMINKDIREFNSIEEYDITLILSFLYKFINTDMGIYFLNRVDNLTKKFMICELNNECKYEIDWILNNSNFIKYEKIKKIFDGNKFTELGVFYK